MQKQKDSCFGTLVTTRVLLKYSIAKRVCKRMCFQPSQSLRGSLSRQAVLLLEQYVNYLRGNIQRRWTAFGQLFYTAEEVSAVILKKLKNDAEIALGQPITDAVITVPAYFDDARRTATRQAGQIAGLNVLRVLNEPTAAAMSYGLSQKKNGTVLVYDLGGGTFDVTIMDINDGEFDVLATDGNRNLGGFDFDNRIAEYVFEQIKEQGIERDVRTDDALVAEIREKSEIAKKSLTTVAQATIMLTVDGKHVRIRITRDEFESRTEDLLNTTKELVEDAMESAGKSWSDIDHLLLVGGSTRMPMVRKMMSTLSGKDPELNVNPDEAVAMGAAIQAYISANEQSDASFYSEKVKHLKYPTIKNKKRASVDTQTRFQQRLLRYFLPYCCSMQSVLGLMVITDFPC